MNYLFLAFVFEILIPGFVFVWSGWVNDARKEKMMKNGEWSEKDNEGHGAARKFFPCWCALIGLMIITAIRQVELSLIAFATQ